ncbi:MAG TPA: hypothetical protein DCR44_01405 [Acholeplasmatales bacterium]|nr:MAG: hypothetical protein A2Y16_06775 [Tenericutes bacterium GWF2_57_13]HAQ56054.1 hypothetical protein [Acholeplasmatales bacterium]
MDLKRRLFALKIKWETVRQEFKLRGLLDALFAGIVYATLITVPVVAVLIELMLISMHRLYFFAVLYILAAFGFVWLVNRLAYVALKLKRPDHESDAKGLLIVNACVWTGFVLITGILFLTVFIPALTA